MDKYMITGMSCAACSARVEKAVSEVTGVNSCSVNLLTNSMMVEGTASSESIINAVVNAGYGASLRSNSNNKNINNTNNTHNEDELKDTETPKLKKRLIASVVLLIPLMYVSMGHMMWDWPLPKFLDGNHMGMGLYEMLITIVIMIINNKFFTSGFKGLIHKNPNMDTLVALGASAAFIYSVVSLFAMTYAISNGDSMGMMKYMDEFYFESAATILTLITVGKTLEARAKGKTTDALKSLMKLSPKTAVIIKDNKEITIPIEDLMLGDIFVVRPGETVPVDGKVIEGISAVNESALTGESIPIDKKPGDGVFAATINQSGHLICEATKVGEDTTLSKIIQMVSDAAATKAPIAKIADKISGIFVPTVISIAIVTFIAWVIAGQSIGYCLARAISVLVISCPCALGLATPVAIMVGNGVGARNGILFKNAVTLEQTGAVNIVALDKTGTITTGVMELTDIYPSDSVTSEELLTISASLEAKSEHPISKAITNKAKKDGLTLLNVINFEAVAGNGLLGTIDNKIIYGGNREYIKKVSGTDVSDFISIENKMAKQGKTPVYFSTDEKVLGLIGVADTIKDDSKAAIKELEGLGLSVVMLTGDNDITAKAIASEAGISSVISSVKPDEKGNVIAKLMEHGKVAMVGDGINDAPALTKADVGIAIGAGTDIAIDAAGIVLTKNTLKDVAAAVRISRKTIKNIYENLFWAFIYNVIGIPLAAGCFVKLFGWSLNPMFGAAAMSLSSFCVVMNALRLNFIKVYDEKKLGRVHNKGNINIDNIIKDIKEDKVMNIKVNGMMCAHCEGHVKAALEKIDGITEAVANHDENMVSIKISKDVSEDLIKAAVLEAGYEYAGIM